MNTKNTLAIGCLLAATLLALSGPAAGQGQKTTPATTLTPAGEKLAARYAETLAALQAEIEKSLPQIDEQKKAAYTKGCEDQKTATARLKAAQDQIDKKLGKPKGMIDYVNAGWLPRNSKAMVAAEAALKNAKTDAEREAAQKAVAGCQTDKENAIKARQKCEEELAAAKREEPKLIAERDAAQKELDDAKARTMQAVDSMKLNAFLSSGKLDPQLVKFEVLFEATPKGLAAFAQQGAEQAALVEKLLVDNDLMKQMVLADGAAGGQYGRAMEIYAAIQKASAKAKDGVLQRLALAVALEHAVPVKQENPVAKKDGPATVDPMKRYLSYEKAFLAGELDPAFKSLSTWDLRFVVDGDEPDEIAAWGREMLRNYRSDLVLDSNYDWRYVQAVRTDVHYGSKDVKYDRPELQNYQNIIMNGGVCGRRAWFGRFILRAFGIPTTARPQPGHAALVHWTPRGWVPCLGGGWGSGSTKTRYKGDLDFLATTQARANMDAYMQVKRAQWAGDVLGEKRIFGFSCGEPGVWYGVSLYRQQAIVEQAKSKALTAVGTELGEANESAETKAQAVEKATATDADKKVLVAPNGVITVPAAACAGRLSQMKSFLGGLQAFCSGTFTCSLDVARPGKYQVTARVVTVHREGKLQLTANNAAADMAIPYTTGMWQKTEPVEVTLVAGKNELSFANPTAVFSIKDITLTPVK